MCLLIDLVDQGILELVLKVNVEDVAGGTGTIVDTHGVATQQLAVYIAAGSVHWLRLSTIVRFDRNDKSFMDIRPGSPAGKVHLSVVKVWKGLKYLELAVGVAGDQEIVDGGWGVDEGDGADGCAPTLVNGANHPQPLLAAVLEHLQLQIAHQHDQLVILEPGQRGRSRVQGDRRMLSVGVIFQFVQRYLRLDIVTSIRNI